MKRILVATDLGTRSNSAMERAVRLAVRDGARLRVVHAAEEPAAPDGAPASHRRIRTEARIMAEEIGAAELLDVSVRVTSGNAARAIARESGRFEPDLVVLGGHGDPKPRDLFLSTTAMQVSRDVAAPVLVVQGPGGQPYRKIMVAVDEPAEAASALRIATAIAPAGEFFAVHAFAPTFAQALVEGDRTDEEEAALQRELDDIVSGLPAGMARFCHARAREGDVMEVLMDLWEELEPDLLVIATHARHGLARLLVGNLAETILLACPCDLLLAGADAAAPRV